MNGKRVGLTALLAMCICLLASVFVAQAQYSCATLDSYDNLYDDEIKWYNQNCVGDDDDNEDDDQDEEESKDKRENAYRPPDVTCPHLPSRVVVSGYAVNSQCQMVGEVVIAWQPELYERGFIDAVDVWNYVNGGIEVCFRNHGWLAFLDAAYAPRRVMELEPVYRDGMTCGRIDGAGTVVLLESPPAQPSGNTLPVFESIPLFDCQIKLAETLFLRAEPAGEIIGLVWLYSEVPAFEIKGYWYKIEFEGVTGYISRYHREVLRGGCG